MTTLTPCLWFDTEAQDAANFYLTVFPNSRITDITYYGEAGPRPAEMVLTVEFELDGHPFTALNGGPEFSFSEAVSFQIDCADQAEVDRYWEALTADGGQESMCGWLKDKYGLSWQMVPRRLVELLADPDPGRAQRVMAAMLSMRKLVIADLEAAADRSLNTEGALRTAQPPMGETVPAPVRGCRTGSGHWPPSDLEPSDRLRQKTRWSGRWSDCGAGGELARPAPVAAGQDGSGGSTSRGAGPHRLMRRGRCPWSTGCRRRRGS